MKKILISAFLLIACTAALNFARATEFEDEGDDEFGDDMTYVGCRCHTQMELCLRGHGISFRRKCDVWMECSQNNSYC